MSQQVCDIPDIARYKNVLKFHLETSVKTTGKGFDRVVQACQVILILPTYQSSILDWYIFFCAYVL